MDLYTLTNTFMEKDVVDEYISAIWTERYSVAGDFQIVAAATPDMIEKLKEGTYLALRGSDEVMIIDTVSIEKSQLTAVGSTFLAFLNNRFAWFRNPDATSGTDIDARVVDYTVEDKAVGEFISQVVNLICIAPSVFPSPWNSANLDWDREIVPGLSLGAIDASGGHKKLTMPVGPLYDGIADLASKENVGVSLYLASADPVTGFVLKFKTYRGLDRTSDQTTNTLVRLVPEMDSLTDLKEVRSIANWKNVCYVYYKGIISKHYETPELAAVPPEGFERRSLVTNPNDEPAGHKVQVAATTRGLTYGTPATSYTVVDEADVVAFREQNARDALANHNYIRAIDGRTSPQNDYKFGIDYFLGDTIELEGLTGTISKARITEYIRSEDKTGEKEYPTISVIRPEGE